jgi:AmmeMemoRadiSam system protein B
LDHPKLRNVEIFPIVQGQRRMLALRDPSGLARGTVLLPTDAVLLLQLFDGQHSIREIQTEVARRSGQLVMSDDIVKFAGKLDEALMLDSKRFAQHRREVEQAYLAADAREATHAGQSYHDGPEALAAELDEMLALGADIEPVPWPARALVAPHIDFERGRRTYGAAYAALRDRCEARRFVVLGTAHFESDAQFIATEKAFDTPLGRVPTDREMLAALQRRCTRDLLANQAAHRQEHSVEFQVVFLQHLFGDREPSMVPVLCPSLQEAIDEGVSPMEVEVVAEFVDALRATIQEADGPTCVVAGADLSHIGRQFGDAGLSSGLMELGEREDRAMLECAEKLDAEGFYASVAKDGDRRHVCGLTAIYVLLQSQALTAGRLLRYEQAVTRETASMVSFAAMAFG